MISQQCIYLNPSEQTCILFKMSCCQKDYKRNKQKLYKINHTSKLEVDPSFEI